MFELRNLEVVHWDYWERFSLPLDANIVTVVGPNGSGKTTLLDALRTLLTIDCAGNRDFKNYLRHNGKPFAWLRAVVGNPPGPTGARPFFPIMDPQATLFCRIQKKGGEWQRQYAVLPGDVSIERAEETNDWIGLREYRVRLEGAGLSQAIRRVLTLEQGATDKLCQLPPRSLLDLVFDVFGDKSTLEDYQRARSDQVEAEREMQSLDHQSHLLGISLQEAEGRVRALQEWQALRRERQDLVADLLPRCELGELRAAIRGARPQLLGARRRHGELAQRQHAFVDQLALLDERESELRAQQQQADRARADALEALNRARAAHTENAVLLKQQARLQTQVEQQDGADRSAMVAQMQADRTEQANLAGDEHQLQTEIKQLNGQLAAWRSGRRFVPDFETAFRAELERAGVKHRMLSEIVEIVEPRWQAAVEAVLAGYRHVVLLDDAGDREAAWALGEKLRYKHFVVADRAPAERPTKGSLLEVVRFNEWPPEWLSRQLDRIQRVDTVNDGAKLSRDQDWITPTGYFKERRGGRHLGVDDVYFGTAARERQLADGQNRLRELEEKLQQVIADRRALSQRISDAEALLRGSDALSQLAQRSEEFAEAAAQREVLEEAVQRGAAAYAEADAAFEAIRERRQQNARERDDTARRRDEDERQRSDGERQYLQARTEQAQRLQAFRAQRRKLAPSMRTAAALAEARERYESPQAVRREIERIEHRLRDGHWETDETCVPLRDKLANDHRALRESLDRRTAHLQRAKRSTEEARHAYLNVLRATARQYGRNLRHLAELAGIGVEVDAPEFGDDDTSLAQAGLHVRFEFDKKGWIGLDDGEASGGQQVMKSLLLLVALMRDESRPGGFVFIDEPFAHLDIFNIDKVGAFLKSTRAQYILTTPVTHNVNVFSPSELTLVTSKRRPGAAWAQPVAVLRKATEAA